MYKYNRQRREEIKARRMVRCECECGLSYTLKNNSCHYKAKIHAKRMQEIENAQLATTES